MMRKSKLLVLFPQWIGGNIAGDHVHLSKAGYALTADRLFTDLMRAYDDWKRAPRRR